jgi:hypothetical protein
MWDLKTLFGLLCAKAQAAIKTNKQKTKDFYSFPKCNQFYWR